MVEFNCRVRWILYSAVLTAISIPPAAAVDYHWNKSAGGNYETAANWTPVGLPGLFDYSIFDISNSYVVNLTQAGGAAIYRTTGSLRVINGSPIFEGAASSHYRWTNVAQVGPSASDPGSSASLTIRNSGQFGVMMNNLEVGNTAGKFGQLNVDTGGILSLDPGGIGTMYVGDTGTGFVSVSSGGHVTTPGGTQIANHGGRGTVELSDAGSQWNDGGSVFVGSGDDPAAEGSLEIFSGAHFNGSDLTVATEHATGSLTVGSPGSILSLSGTLSVGTGGTADVSVYDGGSIHVGSLACVGCGAADQTAHVGLGTEGSMTAAQLWVGLTPDAAGEMFLTDAGTQVTALVANIGLGGSATVTIQKSAAFTSNALAVGWGFGSTGNLVLDGGVVHVPNGTLEVGRDGTGTMSVGNGSAVDVTGNVSIGENFGSEGTLAAKGATSHMTVTGKIDVGGSAAQGEGGVGELTVGQGAAVTASAGVTIWSQGVLNVDSGGTLTYAGQLQVRNGSVSLNGGTLQVNGFDNQNGVFHWTSGTVQFLANAALNEPTLGYLLGSARELKANQTIAGPGKDLLLEQGSVLNVAGGILSSASFENYGALTVSGGQLTTTGALINNSAASGQVLLQGSALVQAGSVQNDATWTMASPAARSQGGVFTNNGIVQGTGTLAHQLVNQGTVLIGGSDRLVVANGGSASSNTGGIQLGGGRLEFSGVLNNQTGGFISGRGTLATRTAAPGQLGLNNQGAIAFSGGVSDVYGDVQQQTGGKITITGGATVTFHDDVTIAPGAANIQASSVGNIQSSVVFLGSYNGGVTGGGAAFIEGDHRPGNSPALVSFGGDVFYGSGASLAIEIGGTTAGTSFDKVVVADELFLSGTLNVSLINSFVPIAGQSFDILDFASLVGTFDDLNLPTLSPGLIWNTSQLYMTGMLSVSMGLAGDYNEDGTVNAADYTVWRNNLGAPAGTLANDVDGGSIGQAQYDTWKTNFGTMAGGGALASAEVPEPGIGVLLAIGLVIEEGLRGRVNCRNAGGGKLGHKQRGA
jgi:T5SS/PEP-CTERM-associated repeat protein